jgi:hypothetical protein
VLLCSAGSIACGTDETSDRSGAAEAGRHVSAAGNTGTGGDAGGDGGRMAGRGGSRAPTAGSSAGPIAGSTGGAAGKAATSNGGTGGSGGAPSSAVGCDAPGLSWKTANKTNYTSYPDPGSEECIKYNGCMWAGQFAACDGKKSESWVSQHNIAAFFPGYAALALHDLCLRKGDKTLVVTVLDTCGDDDCDGCCTENRGNADALIDLESYTNERWGVEDGRIEWADLGPTTGDGCD